MRSNRFNLLSIILVSMVAMFSGAANASWVMIGERATTEYNGSVIKTSPINVTGFASKTSCNNAALLQQSLTYVNEVVAGKGKPKTTATATCHNLHDIAQ